MKQLINTLPIHTIDLDWDNNQAHYSDDFIHEFENWSVTYHVIITASRVMTMSHDLPPEQEIDYKILVIDPQVYRNDYPISEEWLDASEYNRMLSVIESNFEIR